MRTPERIAYDDNPEGLERELAPGGGFVAEHDEAGVVSVRVAATWELVARFRARGPAAAPLLRLMHLPTREVVMLRLSVHYPRIEHPYAMAFDERGALCVLCAGGEFSVFEPAR